MKQQPKLKNALHGWEKPTQVPNTSSIVMMETMNVEHALVAIKELQKIPLMSGVALVYIESPIG